jgi:DNA-directed RNA polymerase delta subunit
MDTTKSMLDVAYTIMSKAKKEMTFPISMSRSPKNSR